MGAASAAVGVVVGVINTTGVGFRLGFMVTGGAADMASGLAPLLNWTGIEAFSQSALQQFISLVLIAMACILMGAGLPTTALYIMLVAVAQPALAQLGVPALATHMFVLYYGVISEITPPVCASAYAAGRGVTEADLETVDKIFTSVGRAFPVKEELLDAVTGLSGSGPAYVYLFIEALADGGVMMGLPRDLATQLAVQTVAGSAGMVSETMMHPALLREMVTSPGGTTIAGLSELEHRGVRSAVMDAVRAATLRARELGGGDAEA